MIKEHWFGYTADGYEAYTLSQAQQRIAYEQNPIMQQNFQRGLGRYLMSRSVRAPALWGAPKKIKSLILRDSK